MFSKGSYVIYRAEGVCVISDIKTEKFNALDKETQFYILNPVNDRKSMLYVPVDNETLTSMMRPLLSAKEIVALAEELRQLDLLPEGKGHHLAGLLHGHIADSDLVHHGLLLYKRIK